MGSFMDSSIPFSIMKKVDRMNRGPEPVPLLRPTDPMVYSTVDESHRELFSKEVLMNDGYDAIPITSTSHYIVPAPLTGEVLPPATSIRSTPATTAIGLLQVRTPATFITSGRLRTSASKVPPTSTYNDAYDQEASPNPRAALNLKRVDKMPGPEHTTVVSRRIAAMEEKANQGGIIVRREKISRLVKESRMDRADAMMAVAEWERTAEEKQIRFEHEAVRLTEERRRERLGATAARHEGSPPRSPPRTRRPRPDPLPPPEPEPSRPPPPPGGVQTREVSFPGYSMSGPHELSLPARFLIDETKPLHQTTGAGFKMPRAAPMPKWKEHERLLGAIAVGLERQRSHESQVNVTGKSSAR